MAIKKIRVGSTDHELQTTIANVDNLQETLDGKANKAHAHPYGVCSTAAATAAKTVTVNNFSLETGVKVVVKIQYKNTASSPTLNVNNTGAKPIYYNGSAITASYLAANKVYEFVYNGTQWDLVGDVNTDTHYTTGISAGASGATSNASATDPYIVIRDNSNYRGQVRLKGDGATTVQSDANGNITISSTDTDTKVKQMKSVANGNFPLLLAPNDVADTDYRYSYYASGIYANPSLKRVYADINGTSTGVRGVTSNNFLVGSGSGSMVEMTPSDVLSLINGTSVATMTTAEYEALDTTSANTLYMLTDGEEDYYTKAETDTLMSEITSIPDSDIVALFS